jgi:hypothetical protein
VVEETLAEPDPGFNLAVSISNSPDLARLGLTDTHVDMALGEVARAVLNARGRLTYGGHLEAEGYTAFLIHECEKYGANTRPFTGSIPWVVHRRESTETLVRLRREINVFGRYEFLNPDGEVLSDPTADRGADPEDVDSETTIRSLTAIRVRVTAQTDGRLVMGGKRDGYLGRMPGVVEETILAVRARKPLFVAGGFGGAAADIALVLGLDPDGWLGLPDRSGDDGLRELADAAAEIGFDPRSNGLSAEQNRQLAVSYRASEIASLVVVGLINRRGDL